MRTKYLQRNKVTLSLGPKYLVWMLRLEYEWLSNLKSVPLNYLKVNVSCYIKNLKFRGTSRKRFCYICHQRPLRGKFHVECKKFQFGTETIFFRLALKKLLSHLKSAPSNFSNCQNFVKKLKCLNLGPKLPYLNIFGLDFENNIVIFEISTLEFI